MKKFVFFFCRLLLRIVYFLSYRYLSVDDRTRFYFNILFFDII